MTIHQQSSYIVSHPGFKSAVANFINGDPKDITILLTDVQFHCIDVQIKNSAREYGACKRMVGSDIKTKLLNIQPPENLNVQLHIPIVKKQDECKVVSIKDGINQIKKRVARFLDPSQLALTFPEILKLG